MNFKRINRTEAEELLIQEGAVLLDIRDKESYDNGHVAGAIHFTREIVDSFIQDTQRNISLLVMCYHGNSSQTVAQYLTEEGFTSVYSIDGGYAGWNG